MASDTVGIQLTTFVSVRDRWAVDTGSTFAYVDSIFNALWQRFTFVAERWIIFQLRVHQFLCHSLAWIPLLVLLNFSFHNAIMFGANIPVFSVPLFPLSQFIILVVSISVIGLCWCIRANTVYTSRECWPQSNRHSDRIAHSTRKWQ